jgi:pyridoxine 4-dehydrogenase
MVSLAGQYIGEVGLGTAQLAFRSDLAPGPAIDVVRAAVANGVRIVDTALAYTRPGVEGYAETIVRDALAGNPLADDVLVATKGGHWWEGEEFPIDGRPATLRKHCDASLRALGTERIGLYQLHWVDDKVPLVESVQALAELQLEGKIAHIGLSNVTIPQLELARSVATITAVQNRLGYDYRSDLPMALLCSEIGIPYLAYMPLGGPKRAGPSDEDPRRAIAQRHQVSLEQITLSWLRAQAPAIVPIVGSSSVPTILDSIGSVSVELLPEELALLDGWDNDEAMSSQ